MKFLTCFILFLTAALTPSLQAAAVDLVVFSYNRPMQLYAFLESAEKYLTGLNQLHVIYRSGAHFEAGYRAVSERFPAVRYHKQAAEPATDFKRLVLSTVFSSKSRAPYVVFAVDDIIVTDRVDLKVCTKAMEKHQAYGFYLRMGKNIRECYSMRIATPCPKGESIGSNLFKWRYSDGEGDWKYPNSVDMTIYRKRKIEPFLRGENYIHPPSMEGRWADAGAKKLYRRGICFRTSKMINIPLNSLGPYNNRHMHSYTPEELQEKFKSGLKVDIARFHRMRNTAPHVDCELTFIPRR